MLIWEVSCHGVVNMRLFYSSENLAVIAYKRCDLSHKILPCPLEMSLHQQTQPASRKWHDWRTKAGQKYPWAGTQGAQCQVGTGWWWTVSSWPGTILTCLCSLKGATEGVEQKHNTFLVIWSHYWRNKGIFQMLRLSTICKNIRRALWQLWGWTGLVRTSREYLRNAKQGPHKQKGEKVQGRMWNNIYRSYSLEVKIILYHIWTRMPCFIVGLNGDTHRGLKRRLSEGKRSQGTWYTWTRD